MKLYMFTVNVKDGEHEYLSVELVLARDERSANRRARNYAQRFLGSRMKWSNEYSCFEPDDGYEYRLVEYSGVQETTAEDIVRQLTINHPRR